MSVNPPPEHLLHLLQTHWGYDAFRPLQEDIIRLVLRGEDVLALLPTGGGKSLCYQLPAIAVPGCCLVISPLIALMEDQVAALEERNIPAIALHGGMSHRELQDAMAAVRDGGPRIIYCSPERLQTRAFRDLLSFMPLSLIAVDEAHCVSQWGHDFRPEYMDIAWLRKLFVRTPMLALTATATPAVADEILRGLRMPEARIVRQSFARDNIFYELRRSEGKPAEVLRAVHDAGGSGIVYCRSRAGVESICHALKHGGISAAHYHAGMKSPARAAAQDAWMRDEVRIMVATTAFGMGIDKADVRLVLHYEPPGDIESWYQESGRAGRDGMAARAITLYDDGDLRKLKASANLQYPPPDFLRKVYQSVVEYLQIPVSAQPERYYPFDFADFCRKFSLRPAATVPAVRLLAQEGLWTLTDTVLSPPRARFIVGRQQLDDFMLRNPALGLAATALLRLYAGIFSHSVPVHLSALAAKLKWKQEDAERAMVALARMGMIEWTPVPEGPRLFFNSYRVESGNLILNTERIALLRQRHEARTGAMMTLLSDGTVCREKRALAYFGEKSARDACGHCDVCYRKVAGIPDAQSVRTTIYSALEGADQSVPLDVLSSLVPTEAAPAMIDELRMMVSSGLVEWHPDNTFSLVPKAAKRRKKIKL